MDLPRARVRVAGELDRESAPQLLDALTVLVDAPPRRWRLDVRDVTFCDVGGLRALTHAHRLATDCGQVLHLARPSRPVARLVGLVGHELALPAPLPAAAGSSSPRARRSRYVGCGATRTP